MANNLLLYMLILMHHYILIKTKRLITDKLWGIYYKPDIEGLGVQGGTSPYIVQKHFDKVNVDPYGVDSLEYQTTNEFSDMWS